MSKISVEAVTGCAMIIISILLIAFGWHKTGHTAMLISTFYHGFLAGRDYKEKLFPLIENTRRTVK
jgi:hypothetical protein